MTPIFGRLLANCPDYLSNRMCAQHHAGEEPPTPFLHDARIRAAVLADPGLGPLFLPNGLKNIAVPVQL